MPPLTEWIRAEMILMIRNADAAAVPMGGLSEMEISLFARDGQFDDDDNDLRPIKIKYMPPSAYKCPLSSIAGTTVASSTAGVDNSNNTSSGFKTNLSGLAEPRTTVMSMTLVVNDVINRVDNLKFSVLNMSLSKIL